MSRIKLENSAGSFSDQHRAAQKNPALLKAGFHHTIGFYPFRALLEALSGLIFAFLSVEIAAMCDARLQFPFFHFSIGSGHAEQNQPD
jgi:hypothetical protein